MKESQQDFENLKRLLKLKRHEVPPPGYFNQFSGSVIARLKAGERRPETLAERLNVNVPWLASLLQIFESRPGVVGAFATCLCLLLVLGVVFTGHSDTPPEGLMSFDSATAPTSGNALASLASSTLAAPTESSGIVASTNPVVSLQPTPAMFGQQNPLFQNATFAVGR